MRPLILAMLLLSGCVSMSTYNRDMQAEYHKGRIEVIWRVSGWLDGDEDLTSKDFKMLIDGLKTGEFIWSCYALSVEASHLRWWDSITHQDRDKQ